MNQQPVLPHESPILDRHNLPVQPPDKLFGRESDLAALQLLLKADIAVLLPGPAGIGKTALTATLAAEYVEQPGGVLWLDSANDSFLSLLNRVARAYAVESMPGETDLTARIKVVYEVLQQHHPLVVLDGQVNLDAAREFIQECAAELPLVFTYSHQIDGPWTTYPVSFLSEENALAMLRHVVGDSFPEDSAEMPKLNEALGGHALSISIVARQLAASQIQPDAWLARLPELPPGSTNQAMGVLMAAYRVLPKELQGMALLLGAALGGRANGELLSDVTGAPVDTLHTRMHHLVTWGFATECTADDQPYFYAHEQIQTFTQTFLRGKKQLDTIHERYLNGLLTYIRRYTDANTLAHHRQLVAMMKPIMSAGIYAANHGQPDYLEELTQLLVPKTSQSFIIAGGFQLELDWLRHLIQYPEVAATGILGQVATSAVEIPVEEVVAEAIADTAPPELDVTTDTIIENTASEPEPAFVLGQVVAPIAPITLATSVTVDTPEEEPVAAPPDTLREPTPSPEVILPGDIETLQKLGAKVAGQGTMTETLEHYSRALENYQADGNVEDELAAVEALAMLSLEGEHYEDVLAYVDQGINLAQDLDNPQREGELLIILGDLQVTLGRMEGAEKAYQEAINALRPAEAWLNIGLTLDKLASVYWEQQRYQDALDVWTQTLPIFERLERLDYVRAAYGKMGDTQTELQRWIQARDSYSRAFELAQAASDNQDAFEFMRDRASLAESRGEHASAVLDYRRALHLAFELDNAEQIGHILLPLANLLLNDTTHLHRAVQILETAQERMAGDTEIQRLLGRAQTRQQRLTRAGVNLPMVEDSLQNYAQAAFEQE